MTIPEQPEYLHEPNTGLYYGWEWWQQVEAWLPEYGRIFRRVEGKWPGFVAVINGDSAASLNDAVAAWRESYDPDHVMRFPRVAELAAETPDWQTWFSLDPVPSDQGDADERQRGLNDLTTRFRRLILGQACAIKAALMFERLTRRGT